MKKTYEVKVVRTDVIKVEIDTDIIDMEWLANYRKWFVKLGTRDPRKELAEIIAKKRIYNDAEYFLGIGRIAIDGTPYTDQQLSSLAKGFRIIDDQREEITAETIKLQITN